MKEPRQSTVFNEVLTLTILWIFVFAPFHFNSLTAQNAGPVRGSELKTAKFYFVTPTANLKMAALQEKLQKAQDLPKRERIKNRISRARIEADSFSHALRNAVARHFRFTDFDFVADTSLKQLLDLPLSKDSVFIVRRSETESGADALIVHNSKMQPLERPVPYYARLTGLSSFIDALFGNTSCNWKDLEKVIDKWSQRMEEYASRHP